MVACVSLFITLLIILCALVHYQSRPLRCHHHCFDFHLRCLIFYFTNFISHIARYAFKCSFIRFWNAMASLLKKFHIFNRSKRRRLRQRTRGQCQTQRYGQSSSKFNSLQRFYSCKLFHSIAVNLHHLIMLLCSERIHLASNEVESKLAAFLLIYRACHSF